VTDDPRHPAAESSRERVHRLASLGRLVVLAGIDRLPLDLLLGLLLEGSDQLRQLSELRCEALRERGAALLRARSAEKRAWTVHRQHQGLHGLELEAAELETLLRALGRRPPVDPSKLVRALLEALGRSPERRSGK